MRPAGKSILALMTFLVGALGYSASSHGHALQPGYLELRLNGTEQYVVLWKTPASGGRSALPLLLDLYRIEALETSGFSISSLPFSIKVLLEAALRQCDGVQIQENKW